MTEEKQKSKSRIAGKLNLSSRFWKTFLTILAAFLTFAGPTYVPYVLTVILNFDYFPSITFGIVLLMVGLVLLWYLIKNKVIS